MHARVWCVCICVCAVDSIDSQNENPSHRVSHKFEGFTFTAAREGLWLVDKADSTWKVSLFLKNHGVFVVDPVFSTYISSAYLVHLDKSHGPPKFFILHELNLRSLYSEETGCFPAYG